MKVLYLIGCILTLISILNFAEIDMAYESSLNLVQNLDQIRNQQGLTIQKIYAMVYIDNERGFAFAKEYIKKGYVDVTKAS